MAAGPKQPIDLREARKRRNGAAASGGASGEDTSWKKLLIVNDKGVPSALLANAITALRSAPEMSQVVFFDEFHQRIIMRHAPPWGKTHEADIEWAHHHDALLADWLQHQRIPVSPEVAAQAVDVVARERPVHPVREYLDRQTWDGVHRLDGWVSKYLGTESKDFAQAAGAKWMIAAVARVYRPGCKVDNVLVLEGDQGTLKSSALKELGNPWFSDEVAELGTRDAAMQLPGVWIFELSELEGMTRGDLARVKAFISRGTDRFRPPYGRRVVEIGRQCVFAGTVNLSEYLRDETGNRRYWPIACGRVDLDGLAEARDQLWAEARDRFQTDESWWLNSETLVKAAVDEQRKRYHSDPWELNIQGFIRGMESTSVGELLGDLGVRLEKRTQLDSNRVAKCLRALEWERFQYRDGKTGIRTWRYRPRHQSPLEQQ